MVDQVRIVGLARRTGALDVSNRHLRRVLRSLWKVAPASCDSSSSPPRLDELKRTGACSAKEIPGSVGSYVTAATKLTTFYTYVLPFPLRSQRAPAIRGR